jgi:uncharacterized protein YbbC (DUF1343 family)
VIHNPPNGIWPLRFILFLLLTFSLMGPAAAQQPVPGACNIKAYLPLLKGKKVALLINQTSRVGETSLLDTLLRLQVQVTAVFVPEHGFRGTADAGAHIASGVDAATGLPVVSLYGKNKKPSRQQLSNIDVVVYDLQDVGVRFYTYISTLQYAMEACAESGKRLIVLDRPNPNGFYVDGPVLDTAFRSFVGMQPIPIVYGMTAGEYARMLVGERWFPGASRLLMTVIPCPSYQHQQHYDLPVPPSPNLKTPAAVILYPSLCLFEGTIVSVGRGTDAPFQQWGYPGYLGPGDHVFVPMRKTGASQPLYEGDTCRGKFLADTREKALQWTGGRLNLTALLEAYHGTPDTSRFFNNFFEKLAGTTALRSMIVAGATEHAIRAAWAADINRFKKIRKRYLLYPDFE